jgi:hypothetical protein
MVAREKKLKFLDNDGGIIFLAWTNSWRWQKGIMKNGSEHIMLQKELRPITTDEHKLPRGWGRVRSHLPNSATGSPESRIKHDTAGQRSGGNGNINISCRTGWGRKERATPVPRLAFVNTAQTFQWRPRCKGLRVEFATMEERALAYSIYICTEVCCCPRAWRIVALTCYWMRSAIRMDTAHTFFDRHKDDNASSQMAKVWQPCSHQLPPPAKTYRGPFLISQRINGNEASVLAYSRIRVSSGKV